MPDLCMCAGNCPRKYNCYRYMAKPNQYGQTYSSLESVCISENYKEFIPYKEKYTLNHFIMDEIRKKNNKTN